MHDTTRQTGVYKWWRRRSRRRRKNRRKRRRKKKKKKKRKKKKKKKKKNPTVSADDMHDTTRQPGVYKRCEGWSYFQQ